MCPSPPVIFTLSLHDALPICHRQTHLARVAAEHLHRAFDRNRVRRQAQHVAAEREQLVMPLARSEEHTSELQSHVNLGCRLLREKKIQPSFPKLNVAVVLTST